MHTNQLTSQFWPMALWLGTTLLLLVTTQWAYAAEPVTVRLQSGRTFTAMVDPLTDEETLVLRFEGVATKLWRPVAWNRVQSARYENRDLTAAELRQLAPRIRTSDARRDSSPPTAPAPAAAGEALPSFAEQARSALAAQSRVQQLVVEVYAANWDSDVETDGLELHVTTLDEQGELVAVSGILNVELIGTRPAAGHSKEVFRRGQPFPRLAKWTRQVHANQFGNAGPVFRLPFEALHPEFNDELGAFGVVHARLTAPGHGVFEASADLVRIRPYSSVRDRHQQLRGGRFFAGEKTGRSQ